MAFSVEGRVPLLDLELVEFAAAIPSGLKVSGQTGKYFFKKAMEPFLPHEIIYRGKAGFGVRLRRWMTRDLSAGVRDTLSSRALRERGVFDDAAVLRLLEETMTGTADGAYPLYSLLAFETWCQRVLDDVSQLAGCRRARHAINPIAIPVWAVRSIYQLDPEKRCTDTNRWRSRRPPGKTDGTARRHIAPRQAGRRLRHQRATCGARPTRRASGGDLLRAGAIPLSPGLAHSR